MKHLLKIFILFFCFDVMAQSYPWQVVGAAPSGTCNYTGSVLVKGKLDFYDCEGGVWVKRRLLTGAWTIDVANDGTADYTFDGTTATFAKPLVANVTGALTGNASTSTTLAANGTNCAAGQAALGVDASGNAEGCWVPSGSSSAQVDIDSDSTKEINLNAGVLTFDPNEDGTTDAQISTSGFVGSLVGNASTSTALAADPADCAAGQYVSGINASGTLSCAAVNPSTLSTSPTNDMEWNFAGKKWSLQFTNPTDYGFQVHGTDAWSGDLVHLHQSSGNPVAASDVLHVEYADNSGNTTGIRVTTPDVTRTALTTNGVVSAGSFVGPLTGNSSTTTALAANGNNCSAGQAPLGIDASGNVEGCFTPSGGSGTPKMEESILLGTCSPSATYGYGRAVPMHGASAECVNQTNYVAPHIIFNNTTSYYAAGWNITTPSFYTNNINIIITMYNSVNIGNVLFYAEYKCLPPNSSPNINWSTTSIVPSAVATAATAGNLFKLSITGTATCAADTMMYVGIIRHPGETLDTSTGNIRVTAIKVSLW